MCVDKNNINEEFKMLAMVKNIDEKIEVEVIESDCLFGIYWVIVGEQTQFFENGNNIDRSKLKAGDKIEIKFSGQVMMSYPPQIVAHKITIKN